MVVLKMLEQALLGDLIPGCMVSGTRTRPMVLISRALALKDEVDTQWRGSVWLLVVP